LQFNLLNYLAGLNVPPVPDVFGTIKKGIDNLASSALSESELAIVRQSVPAIASGRDQSVDDAALLAQVDSE